LFDKGPGGPAGNYGVYYENVYFLNYFNDGGSNYLRGANMNSSPSSPNTWYQYVFVQDASGYIVYRNGTTMPLYGDGSAIAPAASSSDIFIGGRADYTSYSQMLFAGKMGALNIWNNKALTSSEVAANYAYYSAIWA
jgi:hypothetical protein